MYLWSRVEDSTSCGYLETEENATSECSAYTHKCGRTRRVLHKSVFSSRHRAKKNIEDAQRLI